MVIENNFSEYLRRRTQGEVLVPSATIYGINAMAANRAVDVFVVVELNKSNYSCYKYNVHEGKFCVTEYNKEAVSHHIDQVLTDELLQNETIMRWWKNVFFESDGVCTYDNYYDHYKIADDSEVTFGEIVKRLSDCISALQLPSGVSQVFLTGELAKNPMLRYVVQEKIGNVHVLFENQQVESLNEHDVIVLPQEELSRLSLNTTKSIKLSELIDSSIYITVPLILMDGVMLSNKTWKDALVNEQEDYSVGGLKFKNLNLKVECDVFQNIFLLCKDLSDNRKVVQIN